MNEYKSTDGYIPTEDEKFMNERMVDYFCSKLLYLKESIIVREKDSNLSNELQSLKESDLNDRATMEEETSLDLKNRARLDKLIKDIDASLEKIKLGDYGYCEENDEPIGVLRLDAMPTTKYSIEALRELEKINGNRPL